MRGSVDDIKAIRDYADELLEFLSSRAIDPAFASVVGDLREAADALRTRADEPLRIAFLGKFSSGKSLLLGVLVGCPDLLPTSANPTTGNVTEIRLRPGTGPDGSVPNSLVSDTATVTFLTEAEVSAVDRDMCRELAAAFAAQGSHGVAEWFRTVPADTEELARWCAQSWGSLDDRLRAIARLVIETRQAAAGARDLLGARVSISRTELAKALTISYAGDLASPPSTSSGLSGGGSHASGAVPFPLVAKVTLEVTVSPQLWDLSSLTAGNEFVLLDFPGVGGKKSSARDLNLTRRWLADVDTVLVMVDSESPGGEGTDTFSMYLRQLAESERALPLDDEEAAGRPRDPLENRLLYCASRFDLLKPPSPERIALAAGDAGLTETALLGASDPLNALLHSGHTSTLAAFLSSVLGVASHGMTPPEELDFGAVVGPARSRAERWRGIADRLAATNPSSDLAALLTAFAHDGGIQRLRAQLCRHVAEHGIDKRVARLSRMVGRADGLRGELVRQLRDHQPLRSEVHDDPAAVAFAVHRQVRQHVNRFCDVILHQARDPDLLSADGELSLREDIVAEAAEQVMTWPLWERVLGEAVDGVVGSVDGDDDLDDDEDLLLIRRLKERQPVREPLPARAQELAGMFRQSCEQLRWFARKRAVESLREWLAARGREGEPLIRRVDDVLNGHQSNELRAYRLVAENLVLGTALTRRVDSDAAKLDARAEQDSAWGDGIRFPLGESTILPWARPAGSDPRGRHLTRVLRIRSALVSAATQIVLEDVDGYVAVLHRRMQKLTLAYRDEFKAFTPDKFARLLGVTETATNPWAADARILENIVPLEHLRAGR